jgi:hypothetical protein
MAVVLRPRLKLFAMVLPRVLLVLVTKSAEYLRKMAFLPVTQEKKSERSQV